VNQEKRDKLLQIAQNVMLDESWMEHAASVEIDKIRTKIWRLVRNVALPEEVPPLARMLWSSNLGESYNDLLPLIMLSDLFLALELDTKVFTPGAV
jgi:hypothetical protein